MNDTDEGLAPPLARVTVAATRLLDLFGSADADRLQDALISEDLGRLTEALGLGETSRDFASCFTNCPKPSGNATRPRKIGSEARCVLAEQVGFHPVPWTLGAAKHASPRGHRRSFTLTRRKR